MSEEGVHRRPVEVRPASRRPLERRRTSLSGPVGEHWRRRARPQRGTRLACGAVARRVSARPAHPVPRAGITSSNTPQERGGPRLGRARSLPRSDTRSEDGVRPPAACLDSESRLAKPRGASPAATAPTWSRSLSPTQDGESPWCCRNGAVEGARPPNGSRAPDVPCRSTWPTPEAVPSPSFSIHTRQRDTYIQASSHWIEAFLLGRAELPRWGVRRRRASVSWRAAAAAPENARGATKKHRARGPKRATRAGVARPRAGHAVRGRSTRTPLPARPAGGRRRRPHKRTLVDTTSSTRAPLCAARRVATTHAPSVRRESPDTATGLHASTFD